MMNAGRGQGPVAKLVPKDHRERSYQVQGVFKMGRSSRSDLVVRNHRISRHHAEIRAIGDGQYCVLDVGSRNGTFVNGERVAGSQLLQNGDEVMVGDMVLTFVCEVPPTRGSMPVTVSAIDTTDVRLDDRQAVTLVSDIRGYTTLSQKHGKAFQRLVAEWFRSVVVLIRRQGGVVDKIHGDGILAYWWVEEASPASCLRRALETCQSLMRMCEGFSAQLRDELKEGEFKIGVGVHLGEITLGNLGSGAVHAFTAVGDAVNLTFRIEELTKEHGYPILLSHEAASHAPAECTLRDLGDVTIRGRSGCLRLFALTGFETHSDAPRPTPEQSDSTQEATEADLHAAANEAEG